MKHYIWLNPVVWSMYDKAKLEHAVCSRGYEIVECHEDHLSKVKNGYDDVISKSPFCVMDMRCPAAVAYAREHYPHSEVVYADIDPILINAAAELSRRFEGEKDCLLTVITPCRELCELGRAKQFVNTRFLTWNEFKEMSDIRLEQKTLDNSPIPPGFFSSYGEEGISLSTEEELDEFFGKKNFVGKKIAEMLYCKEGCHNGNGV